MATTNNATIQRTPIQHGGITKGVAIVKITHADLTAAATTQSITWANAVAAHPIGATSVPARSRVCGAHIRRITDFSGGSVSALVIDLGDAGDTDELIDGLDLYTGAKATAAVSVGNGVYTLRTFEAAAYGAQILFTATGDNVVNLTAGEVEIAIEYETYETAAQVLG